MIIPNVQGYSDCRSLLRDLYLWNKKETQAGSFRYYARKLKWPVSYMNEVIQGKKNLTLNRALELGVFLKLDGVDVERLLFLALKDSDSPLISRYFGNKVKTERETKGYFQSPASGGDLPEETLVLSEEVYSDISLLAISDVIVWADGRVTPDRIAELLFTFPELRERGVMAKKIGILERNGIISPIRSGEEIIGFTYPKKRLFFTVNASTVRHMGQYADNFKRILNSPLQRGWVGSGFLKISRERLGEFKKRFLAFRNWAMEVDKECLDHPKEEPIEAMLFQFDINLLALLDCEKLGVPRLNDWMKAEQGGDRAPDPKSGPR